MVNAGNTAENWVNSFNVSNGIISVVIRKLIVDVLSPWADIFDRNFSDLSLNWPSFVFLFVGVTLNLMSINLF